MKIMKRKKNFSGLVALVMCFMFAFAGQAFAEEFGWPIPGQKNFGYIYYQSYGTTPYSTRYGFGTAIDIMVPVGTEVFAPAPGKVITRKTLYSSGSYYSFGKYIEIEHDDGTLTLYAHLNEFKVELGTRVNRGDCIALSGNLGNSKGAHLHYEMKNMNAYQYYENNGYRDPRTMLDNTPDTSGISTGLLKLNTSIYAKCFTLEDREYRGGSGGFLYTDSSLNTLKPYANWTGKDDEIWLTGVGKNSDGTIWGRISYPSGSSRVIVYVKLRDVLVPGTLTETGTAVNKSGGLYKRRNEGYNSGYWIDPGDTVYLLTEDNGWVQVMYPISGYSYWRIAWLTRRDYAT